MSWKRTLLVFALAALAALAIACGDDDEDVGNDSDNFATDTGAATQADATQPAAGATDPPAANDCPAPSGDAPEPDMTKQYDAPEDQGIDPGKEYLANFKTVRGEFTIKLRPDLAPQHVNSFVFLAREGFYNGTTFHRVLEGFMAQGGDPTGSGSGGPGYNIPAEFTTEVGYTRGTLGMARAQSPDSAGSQFFITFGDTPSLNGQYTIFGEVTEGMEVVDCITRRDPQALPDFEGDAIISVDITEN
ncbi:MAG TPA: peptidylprolyl isomerase [Dehalococcoidia bacterium]|nr:peptidylprolyl isomerase [Dehalococcoidia bacterium]